MEAGERAPQVVVLGAPALDELAELGHDHIVAPLPVHGGAQVVVDLPASVDGEHRVGHLPVDILDVLVVEEHAVGGDGEPEALPLLLLDGAGVGHRLLHGLHGHEGLAAEEVHLDVSPGPGLLDHKVDGLLGGLHVHGHPVAGAKIARGGEAVLAPQVAVVGHVEAQGLDKGGLLHGSGLLPVDVVVLLKEEPLGGQAAQLLPRLLQRGGIVLGQRGLDLLRAVLSHGGRHLLQQVVGHLVQHMHRAAVDIHREIDPKGLKGMYHVLSILQIRLRVPVSRGRMRLRSMEKGWEAPTLFDHVCWFCLLLVVLALLIGDGARGLTGGLARGLALAAAAVSSAVLQSSAVERLDMLHFCFPPI